MAKNNAPKIILLDCDVISHFITNKCLNDLPVILAPHNCAILDYVYNEATRQLSHKIFVDNLIASGAAIKMPFPNTNLAIKQEFALLKNRNYLIGDGERACMAVAKHSKDIVASSNFRDVAPYCNANNILYLGTLDILSIAVNKGIYDEAKCDLFIQEAIKNNKARFPAGVTQMRYYIPKDLSFIEAEEINQAN